MAGIVSPVSMTKIAAKVDKLIAARKLSGRTLRRFVRAQPAVKDLNILAPEDVTRLLTGRSISGSDVVNMVRNLRRESVPVVNSSRLYSGLRSPVLTDKGKTIPIETKNILGIPERMYRRSLMLDDKNLAAAGKRLSPSNIPRVMSIDHPYMAMKDILGGRDTEHRLQRIWGSRHNSRLAYDPGMDIIFGAKDFRLSPEVIHEFGHRSAYSLPTELLDRRTRILLHKLKMADREAFHQYFIRGFTSPKIRSRISRPHRGLGEILAHYIAAQDHTVRSATRSNWVSRWADSARDKLKDDRLASVIEHLERNYNGATGGRSRVNLH